MLRERLNVIRATGAEPTAQAPVVYWVNRDRRLRDNWALIHAQNEALARGVPLAVVFCLVPRFLEATLRQYDFMLRGLEEFEGDCQAHGIAFHLLPGSPVDVLPPWLEACRVPLLVTDFEPLHVKRAWLRSVVERTTCPVHQVDAHNVVPIWSASSKQEFAAYTIRPKITRLLPTFLEPFPTVATMPSASLPPPTDWPSVREGLRVREDIGPVDWLEPGPAAGEAALTRFVSRLAPYHEARNDPNQRAQSDLSPYFHFGHLAPQRAALAAMDELRRNGQCGAGTAAFLEELIVRRELADNFTHYNDHYDSVDGFPAWALATLRDHRDDPRDYLYDDDTWEQARTHDALWNAAQHEMVTTGKMHGYMRMYWAKKILEWTRSPEEALRIAIMLNDRYELDGRDPNGYTGIAWSIGGVHDRAWFERPVYGKIRYMNANGAAKKFDVAAYIARHSTTTLFNGST